MGPLSVPERSGIKTGMLSGGSAQQNQGTLSPEREREEGPGIPFLCVPEGEGQESASLGSFPRWPGPFGPLSLGDAG